MIETAWHPALRKKFLRCNNALLHKGRKGQNTQPFEYHKHIKFPEMRRTPGITKISRLNRLVT